ncbi:MAG: DMT family transporter [Candidatus Methanomethylophilaceae archaeon]|nr:DMT family transporter [Candidatus Methanomethylophilaceae archaeon]
MDKRVAAILILSAAMVASGMLSIFTRRLSSIGFEPSDIAFVRLFVAVAVLFVIIMIKARGNLRIERRDIIYLVIFGVFKFMMDYTFNESLNDIPVGLATLLQNTAPYFVIIISYFAFREKASKMALIAIMMGSFGCVLMAGRTLFGMDADIMGVIFALISALSLSMYYIGSDLSDRKGYSPVTYLFYVLLVAMIVSIPFTDMGFIASHTLDPDVIWNSLILGVVMTLVPFYIMAWSAKYLDTATVSTICVLEVVFAAIVGSLYFGEPLDILDALGIAMMIASIVLISRNSRSTAKNKS